MPIPEFNEIKAPALQFFFADGESHKVSELYDVLGNHFHLTADKLGELLPSGKQRRWHNRVNWACYDLFRAGLLNRPNRGLYVVTDVGKKVAEQNPKMIDRDFLMQFPQFAAFAQATGTKKPHNNDGKALEQEVDEATATKTPDELIGTAFE